MKICSNIGSGIILCQKAHHYVVIFKHVNNRDLCLKSPCQLLYLSSGTFVNKQNYEWHGKDNN